MQFVACFSILFLLASAAAASEEVVSQPQVGSPVVESVVPQPQQQPAAPSPVAVHHQHQQAAIEHQQAPVASQVVPAEHQVHHHAEHQQHYPAAGASYYAPAGLIQVVGGEQQGAGLNKPVQAVAPVPARSAEQYGQPESAALPPNYKPFGSWGLYIGGNPADGYYTNYYKQLGSSVEKQQSGVEQVKPTSALSPLLKQASGGVSPFAGGDYYPFAYSMNELSSPAAVSRNYGVAPSSVEQSGAPAVVHQHVPAGLVSPVQAGAQVYGSPAFESGHYAAPFPQYSGSGIEHYAATKRLGSSFTQQQVQQKELSKAAEMPAQMPAKGYYQQQQQQPRVYVYPPQQVGQLSAPVAFSPAQQVHQQQQQVVAYPVPVASQIVGSQAGVDGAFAPYGVHAFTRYAVKPTVVAGEQSAYHYGASSQVQQPAYKQQQQHQQHSYTHYYPSVGYYGYPLNQLHYSQGSIVPAVHANGEQTVYHGSQPVEQFSASEKSESSSAEDKSQQQVSNKHQ